MRAAASVIMAPYGRREAKVEPCRRLLLCYQRRRMRRPTPSRSEAVKVNGRPTRTIWVNEDNWGVDVIDQRWLPHEFRVATLRTMPEAATAIRDMWVRGAPLIGVTA